MIVLLCILRIIFDCLPTSCDGGNWPCSASKKSTMPCAEWCGKSREKSRLPPQASSIVRRPKRRKTAAHAVTIQEKTTVANGILLSIRCDFSSERGDARVRLDFAAGVATGPAINLHVTVNHRVTIKRRMIR